MSKINKKSYYRPGKLPEKGTKITLKTQPYTNGVLFDINDPITSFQVYLCAMKTIVNNYEIMRTIPGLADCMPELVDVNEITLGKIRLLLDFLSLSPIEITLKEQTVDSEILAAIELNNVNS